MEALKMILLKLNSLCISFAYRELLLHLKLYIAYPYLNGTSTQKLCNTSWTHFSWQYQSQFCFLWHIKIKYYGKTFHCSAKSVSIICVLSPACRCVNFQSDDRMSGVFHSPNYDTPYKPDINCILYTFIGNMNYIVELEFSQFSLLPARNYE